jgi:hypothetical protein
MATNVLAALTVPQRAAILELGSRGAGGEFDQMTLSQLFAMGLIEVRNADRRIGLTERGQLAYRALAGGNSPAQSDAV